MSETPTITPAKPDPVDVSIGSRLRLRRLALGLSQSSLANALGITFQQIQKYERGTNRIVASRLYRLSQVLQVPVQYFFQDLSAREAPEHSLANGQSDVESPERVSDLMTQRDMLRLVQAYSRIDDATVRRQIYALVKTIGEHRCDPVR